MSNWAVIQYDLEMEKTFDIVLFRALEQAVDWMEFVLEEATILERTERKVKFRTKDFFGTIERRPV